MIIDTQASVTILFAVLIGSFSALLVVHTTKDVSKKPCYIAIAGITILLILVVFLLRFWNITIEYALTVLVFVETSIQILLAKLTPVLENFANTVGPYLLIIIDLITWFILFAKLKRLNNKNNILTSVGYFLFFRIFPCLITVFESVIPILVFIFLYSKNCIVHILWISIVSLFVHIIVIKLIYKKFLKIWKN